MPRPTYRGRSLEPIELRLPTSAGPNAGISLPKRRRRVYSPKVPSFATTRWTLIAKARGDSAAARAALNQLCRVYWPPIYAFIRRRHDEEPAKDLTQGFFLVFLERGALRGIDRSRGRFRSFLLAAVTNFLADERARAEALKRIPAEALRSLDLEGAEARCTAFLTDGDTPERTFERAWVHTLMERAMERLREANSAPERAERFEALRGVLTESSAASYAAIGAHLGISEGAVKVAVHRLRKEYREALEAEVADLVDGEAEVEAELRELPRALER